MREFLLLTVLFLVGFIGALLAFGIILHALEKKNMSLIMAVFGTPGIILTGLGTVVHEFGHYIMCKIFGHKVIKVEWFRPVKFKQDGVLGMVQHSYNKKNFYQNMGNFFIGAGPILVGLPIIGGLLYLCLPDVMLGLIEIASSSSAGVDFFGGLLLLGEGVVSFFMLLFSFENLLNVWFWVFIVIASMILLHMSLSGADLKGCGNGLGAFSLVLIIAAALFAGLAPDLGIGIIIVYNTVVLSLMAMGVALSLVIFLLIQIPYRLKRRR